MATDTLEATAEHVVTGDEIIAAMDATWQRLERVLDRFAPVLDAGPDAGGWTPRRLLSHLVGAWQRVPVHAAFFLTDPPQAEVPIQLHNVYWIAEWETAPLAAFVLAMEAAYRGNRAFVRDLDPAVLTRVAHTPFGDSSLGELLLGSYQGHIGDFHIPQLEAFLPT